jgi:hypothetical protein
LCGFAILTCFAHVFAHERVNFRKIAQILFSLVQWL